MHRHHPVQPYFLELTCIYSHIPKWFHTQSTSRDRFHNILAHADVLFCFLSVSNRALGLLHTEHMVLSKPYLKSHLLLFYHSRFFLHRVKASYWKCSHSSRNSSCYMALVPSQMLSHFFRKWAPLLAKQCLLWQSGTTELFFYTFPW